MPILVPIEELQAGMCLHEPLVADGTFMLQSGRPLTAPEIEALRRLYPGLSVRVSDPVLDGIIEFEDDSRQREVAETAQRQIADSMSQVRDRFAERASLSGADFQAVQAAVREIMTFIRSSGPTAAVVTRCLDRRSYLCTHAGNVFYLSMLLGSKVLDYVVAERRRQTQARGLSELLATDLSPLGLGAMVMDIGMLPLEELVQSDQPLTDEQRQAVRQHPLTGAAMLPESFPPAARMIVRTHHENFDGSGYPMRMRGDRLHVFTRIVRIADAYDAATSDRVYRRAKSPARVLWEMSVGPFRRFYDPVLMQVFSRLIQPFPIGARLTLEDGREAVVVRYGSSNPFLPRVVITTDARGRMIPREALEPPVDLDGQTRLRIRSFRGEDQSFIYEMPRAEEVKLPSDFVSAFDAAYP